MRILITNGRTILARALYTALDPNNDVRTVDTSWDGSRPEPTYVGTTLDRSLLAAICPLCDVIIHQTPHIRRDWGPTDIIEAATRGVWNLAMAAPEGCRFILISSLQVFERYPMEYLVNEWWAPRPTTDVMDLAYYLSEMTLREVARDRKLNAVVLRMGRVVSDKSMQGKEPDPRWVHVEDAVQAVLRAKEFDPKTPSMSSWWPSTYHVYHIVGAGKKTRFPLGLAGMEPFGYKPTHDLTEGVKLPLPPAPPREVKKLTDVKGGAAKKVVIFGAGGALGSATTEVLAPDHILRVTNRRPIAEVIAANKPQNPGAPLPKLLEPPHETITVDLRDQAQVMEAVRGMDAAVNCSVVRNDPEDGFKVNTVGVYNILTAMVECGVRRFVQTGVQRLGIPFPLGYWDDFEIDNDHPAHVGHGIYGITKFLADELCRVFAEEHDLEVVTTLWIAFVNPDYQEANPMGVCAVSASWEDAANALRQGLRIPTLPHPFESFYPVADLPHRRIPNTRIKQVLKWQPRDLYEHHWQRELD